MNENTTVDERNSMRHNFLKRILGGILTGCMLVTATVHAGTTQKDIDKAKDQITDLKKQKEDAKDQVDSLTNEKQGLESDLSGLNGQLNTITSDMNQLEQQAAQKEDEINTAAEDLKRSEERSAEQYEDMKVRIQYIYENGNQSVWDMLIHASSIAEFLNQAEYTSAINQYDRNMLTAYQELTEQIKEQKKELEKQKEELTVLQQEKQKEQEKVNSLIEDTQNKIQESSEKIEDAQSDVESIDAKIEKMIEYEKQLEIQKAKEDAARLAAIKKQEQENRSNVTYAPAQSDAYLLAAIIQCEAWGEPCQKFLFSEYGFRCDLSGRAVLSGCQRSSCIPSGAGSRFRLYECGTGGAGWNDHDELSIFSGE